MSKLNKKSINVWAHKHVKADGIKVAILFIPLLVILIKQICAGSFEWESFLDTGILVSFLIVFLCELIADFVIKMIEAYTEDDTKTTTDYEGLVKKYCRDKKNMFVREGEDSGNQPPQGKEDEDEVKYYPVLKLWQRKQGEDIRFRFIREDTRYRLPGQIADHSNALLKAHSQSTIYNNTTIRLDNFSHAGNTLELKYRFTTYFDTMITNRAMDYPFMGGRTIREIYEPGPFVQPLSQSKMSNHIGFNGFVKLKDNKIIFVRRGWKLSTAKRKWSPSVSASLKAKYALDDAKYLTIEGMDYAIKEEIVDELKISEKELSNDDQLSGGKAIIGFYRDLVEGGKPHFVFYYECNQYGQKDFKENFKKEVKKDKKRNKRELIIDGKQCEYFSLESLKEATFKTDSIILKGYGIFGKKKLRMTPSMIVSVKMLLDYLEPKKSDENAK